MRPFWRVSTGVTVPVPLALESVYTFDVTKGATVIWHVATDVKECVGNASHVKERVKTHALIAAVINVAKNHVKSVKNHANGNVSTSSAQNLVVRYVTDRDVISVVIKG